MKVGDLVRRTYGEGERPTGIVVRWEHTSRHPHALIQWTSGRSYILSVDYLEVISEGR